MNYLEIIGIIGIIVIYVIFVGGYYQRSNEVTGMQDTWHDFILVTIVFPFIFIYHIGKIFSNIIYNLMYFGKH